MCGGCAPDIQMVVPDVETPVSGAADEYKREFGTKSVPSLAGSKDPSPTIRPLKSRHRRGA